MQVGYTEIVIKTKKNLHLSIHISLNFYFFKH